MEGPTSEGVQPGLWEGLQLQSCPSLSPWPGRAAGSGDGEDRVQTPLPVTSGGSSPLRDPSGTKGPLKQRSPASWRGRGGRLWWQQQLQECGLPGQQPHQWSNCLAARHVGSSILMSWAIPFFPCSPHHP